MRLLLFWMHLIIRAEVVCGQILGTRPNRLIRVILQKFQQVKPACFFDVKVETLRVVQLKLLVKLAKPF